MSRYINPYTDFGFKKLFGEEANKDLLMDWLRYLEVNAALQTAEEKGKVEGKIEERHSIYSTIVPKLAAEGRSVPEIAQFLGITEKEVNAILGIQ
jgi:predicted transposase YdaD